MGQQSQPTLQHGAARGQMTAAARMGRKREGAGAGSTSRRRSFVGHSPSWMSAHPPRAPGPPRTCWCSPRRSVTPSVPGSSLLSVPCRCRLNLGRGTLGFPSGLNMLAGASTMKAFVTGPVRGHRGQVRLERQWQRSPSVTLARVPPALSRHPSQQQLGAATIHRSSQWQS